MGIVVVGAVFVDVKGHPMAQYIPGGRNVGRVIQVHGGVARNVAEDIANVELKPTFISVVDNTGISDDVIDKNTIFLLILLYISLTISLVLVKLELYLKQ